MSSQVNFLIFENICLPNNHVACSIIRVNASYFVDGPLFSPMGASLMKYLANTTLYAIGGQLTPDRIGRNIVVRVISSNGPVKKC